MLSFPGFQKRQIPGIESLPPSPSSLRTDTELHREGTEFHRGLFQHPHKHIIVKYVILS